MSGRVLGSGDRLTRAKFIVRWVSEGTGGGKATSVDVSSVELNGMTRREKKKEKGRRTFAKFSRCEGENKSES